MMYQRVSGRPIIQSDLRTATDDEPVLSEGAPGNTLLGVGGHTSQQGGPWPRVLTP